MLPTSAQADTGHIRGTGRRWRHSLVFLRMLVSPSVVVRLGERIVANDGVRRIISFACLHLVAEYGPLRSNSTQLAGSCLKLHSARYGLGMRRVRG